MYYYCSDALLLELQVMQWSRWSTGNPLPAARLGQIQMTFIGESSDAHGRLLEAWRLVH